DAGAKLERNRIARIFERAHDVRAAERWMSGKRHLEGRRENAYTRARAFRRKQEGRLGQIELQRQRLHRRIVESAAILAHAQRIAFEGRFGEHVDDSIRVVVHSSSYASTASCSAVRARTSRASARNPAEEMSATSAIAASQWRGKFRSIERA